MIRIGIIGCGRILAAHLEGYRLLKEAGVDNFQITALCSRKEADAHSYVKPDPDFPQREPVSNIPGDPLAVGPEYLSDFQPEVEVAIFDDYEALIQSGKVDAINDFTIHALHHQIAELAFAQGLHLLSQKPLAVTMEGARRMCDGAEKAGVAFGVCENLRYVPNTRHTAWALSDDGPVGPMSMAMMGNVGTWWAPDLIVAETPWRHDRSQAGGMALDMGPHFFDLLRYVGGCEIESVSGTTNVTEKTRYILRDGERVDPIECDADDTFFATFRNTKGAVGTLCGSWSGRGTNTIIGEGPVYYGKNGRVSGDTVHLAGEAEPLSLSALYEANASPELKAEHFPLGLENDFALNQLDWLRAIESGDQPEASGPEGLRDLASAYAVVEAAKAGREVTVEEVANGSLRDYQREIDERFGLI